ncbi:MAG: hypothetical protein IKS31_03200 [Clostridia bacterium]|nr:hypothetical protein [Clostridia bacterium]
MKMRYPAFLAALVLLVVLLTACANQSAGPAAKPDVSSFRTVGATVRFGSYEQDGKSGNGKEGIDWVVVAVKSDKALLVSKVGLEARIYNAAPFSVWKDTTLRLWLNTGFLNSAFTQQEKAAIATTRVDNGASQGRGLYGVTSSASSEDQVFLLSYAELNTYRANKHGLYSSASVSAKNQGTVEKGFWMRNQGMDGDRDEILRTAGVVEGTGIWSDIVTSEHYVCPAIWVDLNSAYFAN